MSNLLNFCFLSQIRFFHPFFSRSILTLFLTATLMTIPSMAIFATDGHQIKLSVPSPQVLRAKIAEIRDYHRFLDWMENEETSSSDLLFENHGFDLDYKDSKTRRKNRSKIKSSVSSDKESSQKSSKRLVVVELTSKVASKVRSLIRSLIS